MAIKVTKNKLLLKELRSIKEAHTLDEIVQILKPFNGFEGLNRATVSRWLNKPPIRNTVRVTRALKVLKSHKDQPLTLNARRTIAELQTIANEVKKLSRSLKFHLEKAISIIKIQERGRNV